MTMALCYEENMCTYMYMSSNVLLSENVQANFLLTNKGVLKTSV